MLRAKPQALLHNGLYLLTLNHVLFTRRDDSINRYVGMLIMYHIAKAPCLLPVGSGLQSKSTDEELIY